MEEEKDILEAGEEDVSIVRKIAQGVVAFLVIGVLLYVYVFSDAVRYRKTNENAHQDELPVADVVGREGELVVPLNIIILQSDGTLGSERGEENLRNLVTQADRIWQQADISLEIRNIITHHQEDAEIRVFQSNIYDYLNLYADNDYDRGAINLFLLRNLQGINGISYGGTRVIAVADYTTVPDFRVLAHEIGHQLGLINIEGERSRLMFQGAEGTDLSDNEITFSREEALKFK